MFEKTTQFTPAFHRIDEGYGVGSMMCRMVLKGDKGAVHFVFSTGIYLPETYKYWHHNVPARKDYMIFNEGQPNEDIRPMGYMGFDVGYHSPVQQYEGQEVRKEVCDYLGVPCFCDGSALRAEEWMDIISRKGSDEIWKMLEQEYNDRFINVTTT